MACLCVVLLAGCSDGDSSDAAVSSSGSGQGLNATANLTAPIPTVSVLHFNRLPTLNRSAPLAESPIALPLAPLTTGQVMTFNITLRGGGNITDALASIWLRLTQTNVQNGPGSEPNCGVSFTVTLVHNGTAAGYAGGCGSLGVGPIAPGDYQVQFGPTPGTFPVGTRAFKGDNLILTLAFYLTPPSQGYGAWFLCGSADRDSWVRLDGLREPIALPPPKTAANTTKAPKP